MAELVNAINSDESQRFRQGFGTRGCRHVMTGAAFLLALFLQSPAWGQSRVIMFSDDGIIYTGLAVSKDGGNSYRFVGAYPLLRTGGTRDDSPISGYWNPQTDTVVKDDPTVSAILTLVAPPDAIGAATNQSFDPAIVGYLDDGMGGPYHAFCLQLSSDYTTGDFTDLGTLDPANNDTVASFANGANSDGSVVVGASYLDPNGFTEHAFLWTQSNGMVDLGSSSGPGGFSRAFGVSGDGSVVVGEEGDTAFPTNAFIWTANGGFQDLGGIFGSAYAVTADGSTVVGQAAGTGRLYRFPLDTGRRDAGSRLFARLFQFGGHRGQRRRLSRRWFCRAQAHK